MNTVLSKSFSFLHYRISFYMYSFPYILLGITQGYFILSHSGAAGLAESKRRMQLKASWYISGRALLPLHKSSASGEMRFGARKLSGSAVIWCIRIDFFRCKKPRQWYMREHKSYFFFILDGCDSAMSHHQLSLWAPVVCCFFSVFQATRYILIYITESLI